ncbi:MAG: glycosyltransferase family 2 protein [Planctomycetota bacterium]
MGSDGPRASVIVRTYNRPEMLERAVRSVAAQTWRNLEVVVVNDAGEDVGPRLDALRPLFERPEDVVYLNFPPERKPGRCRAASEGIEASSGEWIFYLDDDDFWYPEHVEVLLAAAAETGAKVLYSDAMQGYEEPVGENGAYVVTSVKDGPSEDFNRAAFYVGTYIHISTFCHHRSVYDQLGGFDPELLVLEDLDLFFRYAQAHDFHHVKRFTSQFQIRSDYTNAVTSMKAEFVTTREALCRKYLHTVISDLLSYVHEGRGRIELTLRELQASEARVASLEARVARLERELDEARS